MYDRMESDARTHRRAPSAARRSCQQKSRAD
jgi:hypothetical protein